MKCLSLHSVTTCTIAADLFQPSALQLSHPPCQAYQSKPSSAKEYAACVDLFDSQIYLNMTPYHITVT